jgi:hypothetical protein
MNEVPLLLYLVFNLRDFHETQYQVFGAHDLNTRKFGLDRSVMHGTVLGEQSTFSPVSRLPSKTFS